MFCRSLFVRLSFLFWSLGCLSFFDIRILITHLVSSISSYEAMELVDRGNNMVSHYNAVWFGAAVYNGVCWNPAERIRNMSAENRTPNTLEFNVRMFI